MPISRALLASALLGTRAQVHDAHAHARILQRDGGLVGIVMSVTTTVGSPGDTP